MPAYDQYLDAMSERPPRPPNDRLKVAREQGVTLQASVFLPGNDRVEHVLILLHGSTVHSTLGYDRVADELSAFGSLAVVTPDLRGHGRSGGPPGFAACPETIWDDLASMADAVRQRFPGARLHLAGHSAGAGILLNALVKSDRLLACIASVTFIAPFFGPGVATPEAGRSASGYSRTRHWILAAYMMSGGLLFRKSPAVRFVIPSELPTSLGLVGDYSAGMALAITVRAPRKQLARLAMPVLILAGTEDELLSPSKLQALAAGARAPHLRFETVRGDHFTCLLNATAAIRELVSRDTKGGSR